MCDKSRRRRELFEKAHGPELHDLDIDATSLSRVLGSWICACCGFPR